MWVTPGDFPLSLSGLPLTLLVSCGERIGPIFLDLCTLAIFSSCYNTSIFLVVHYIKSKSLCVVLCHTQRANFLELICSFDPTSHNSSRTNSSSTTISSLIGALQVGGNAPNGMVTAISTLSPALMWCPLRMGRIWAISDTLQIFHVFAFQNSVVILCHWILSIFCILCNYSNVTL